MIAESIKQVIGAELLFADSKKDIRKVFMAASASFQQNGVPIHRQQEVLRDVRDNLKHLINRQKDPKSILLVIEAESVIDEMLK